MKRLKNLVMLLLMVALVMGMVPLSAMAVESQDSQVHVTVSNTTYSKADGAPWEGTLVDEWVPINQDSTMMSAVLEALSRGKYSQTGAESNYISEINGLSAFAGGGMSGWMGTLNDWFTNEGFGAFTVKAGTLEAGDDIAIMYTCNYGEDLGGTWGNNDKTLKALKTDAGVLSPAFDPATKSYTLTVENGTKAVTVTPTAANKNYQVRASVAGTEYKRTAAIPVQDGTVISVKCGDPSWPSMNSNESPGVEYTLTVKMKNNAPVLAEGVTTPDHASVNKTGKYSIDLSKIFTDSDGDALTYTVSVGDAEAVAADAAYTTTVQDKETFTFIANDGKADSPQYVVTVTNTGNASPTLKEGVEAIETQSYTWYAGGTSYKYFYPSKFFEDPDGDALIYTVSIDGGAPVQMEGTNPSQRVEIGETSPATQTYVFQASDGKESSPTHTLIVLSRQIAQATITPASGQGVYETSNGRFDYIMGGTPENQIQFTASVLPAGSQQKVTWSINNDSVGSIDDNGLLRLNKDKFATAEGTFEVQATSVDGARSSVYFHVIPGKINIGSDAVEAPLSQDTSVKTTTVKLANNWYNNQLVVSSANPEIATVTVTGQNLTITPNSPGETTIKVAYAQDEANTDTMTVKVTGVRVTRKDGSDSKYFQLKKGATPNTLALQAKGVDANETFTWSSSDESVATVDENGVVTGIKDGPVLITAKSSASTLLSAVKGVIALEVAGEGVPYMDNLTLTSYSSFGWTSNNSGFRSTQLDYHLTSTNVSLASFMFTSTYDGEKYSAKAYYKDSTRQETSCEINQGVSNTLNYALFPGDNTIKIVLTEKADATNTTTYVFNISRPYSATKTITKMMVQPDGSAAQTYPTYKGKPEGTLFKSPEGVVGTATGWSSSTYEYTTYAFEGTKVLALAPTFGDAFEHVRVSVDGGAPTELTADVSSKIPDVQNYGVKASGTALVYEVISSKVWADRLEKGIQDPWSDGAENTYKITILQVAADAGNMKITSAKLSEGAQFFGKGFVSSDFAPNILINRGIQSVTMDFTVPNGYEVYQNQKKDANKLTGKTGDSETTYTLAMDTPSAVSGNATTIVLFDAKSNVQYSYRFAYTAKGEEGVQPSRVIDYLCLGSQYTNSSGYGMLPEKTLQYGGSLKSLGNFGGSITYEFDTPITNDPRNPNGIDFIAFGNCFGETAGAAEPGWVQVSSDGVNWYYLAGSSHYDDEADWNYSMTYTKTGSGASAWTASDGTSGTNYTYPLAANYPLHTFAPGEENSMTVSGLRLVANAKDPYGSASAAYPDFGYVDTHVNNTVKGEATNPYLGSGNSKDGMFDLDWAVDAEGKPVSVDHVKYIKVGTASNIYAGAIGEKSTEITSIYTTQNKAEEAVGKTAAPAGITVDGTALALKDGTTSYRAAVDGAFDVTVDAPEGANVYINGNRGTTRTYESTPLHHTLRIIVQEGEKEASMTYITLITPEEAALEEVQGMLDSLKAPADVTFADSEQIALVRKAYDALSDGNKAQITADGLQRLTDAEAKITALNADVAAAKKVTDRINSLPAAEELTLAYLVPVQDARKAYDGLTPEQKALVSADVLKHLTDDEAKIAELAAAAALEKQKETAKADLANTVNKADYRAAQQAEIDKAIENGNQAINQAKDADGIAQVLAAAKNTIAAIKTDAQLTVEEDAAAAQAFQSLINKAQEKIAANKGGVEDAVKAVNEGYAALSDGAKALVEEGVSAVNTAEQDLAKNNHQPSHEGVAVVATDDQGKALPVDTRIVLTSPQSEGSMAKAESHAAEAGHAGYISVMGVNISMEGTPVEGAIRLVLSVDLDGFQTDAVKVAHVKADGSIELLDAVYDISAKTLTFTTRSFSDFVVLAKKTEAVTPGSGSGNTTTTTGTTEGNSVKTGVAGDDLALAMPLLLAGLAGCLLLARRKAQ
ncbi:Ig-like domain-containing protein [Eubacterium sp.]|uniref:Ig-like domain-containing protein n=1 Tax=Eubacterium sp. TaxID=142586 RepID=UPI002FCC0F99